LPRHRRPAPFARRERKRKRIAGALAFLVALAVAACSPAPQPAHPALWRIDGPHGEQGWLFGTIHALDRPALWRSAEIDAALRGSDRIVVEVGNPGDGAALRKTFAGLARSSGLPPLSVRVEPALRPRLAEALHAAGAREAGFADVETWAAALTLARAGQGPDDAANGIDRAVLELAGGRPVIELEGAFAQLRIFDALPEDEQRRLLAAVLRDARGIDTGGGDLAEAWRRGDMRRIEAETHRGLLADPALREALFTGRNRAWSDRLAAMLARGQRPFVAVGAAHMAGAEGLPALLAARGYKVIRVQ
jgi:uncharacterized protein YbaP (TraB family)